MNPKKDCGGEDDRSPPQLEGISEDPSPLRKDFSAMASSLSDQPPNLAVLAILKQVQDRQKDRRETDPSRTQELIREARAGRMYGFESTE